MCIRDSLYCISVTSQPDRECCLGLCFDLGWWSTLPGICSGEMAYSGGSGRDVGSFRTALFTYSFRVDEWEPNPVGRLASFHPSSRFYPLWLCTSCSPSAWDQLFRTAEVVTAGLSVRHRTASVSSCCLGIMGMGWRADHGFLGY